MMSNIMMIIGAYPFSIRTAAYQQLRRNSRYRWKSTARLGQKPAQHFMGPDSDKITLDGTILPDYAGGAVQLDLMRAQAELGRPLLMVDGHGYIWGDWVITQINEAGSEFDRRGAARNIQFSMTLQEYGDDASAVAQFATLLNAANAARGLF